MCEKCYGLGGWFTDSQGNRVFCLLEDRHGYHAKDMRGTYTICECKIGEEYFYTPDHQGIDNSIFESDIDWFREEDNLALEYFT